MEKSRIKESLLPIMHMFALNFLFGIHKDQYESKNQNEDKSMYRGQNSDENKQECTG